MKEKVKNILSIIGVVAFIIVLIVVIKVNKTCVVAFDTSGGTIYASKNVKCGEKVERPADPVLEGYTFVNWIDPYTKEEFDFNSPINKDIMIKANYIENK